MTRFVLMVAWLTATVTSAAAADEAVSDPVVSDQVPAVAEQVEEEIPDQTLEQSYDEMHPEAYRHAEGSAGYRFVGVTDSGVRAAEYDYLHSTFTGAARLVHLGKDLKLDVDGAYLNQKDYLANLMFDYAGYYRLTARTESLYHNLDHERSELAIVSDIDPSARYGITTRQDMAQFRYKLHDYPIHLNLSHWLIDRQGTQQLRYADFNFEDYYFGPKESHLYSRTRTVHRTSHEATAGFDAHLGPINVVYSFQFREFDDRKSTPSHIFSVMGGPREHNENPESRYYAHTVKLFTSPAGGVTGAASYSYGRRENNSSLTTVVGADKGRDTLQNAAGDFTYSPCAWFTTVLKYRHQEIDRDAPSTLLVPSLSSTPIPLREGIDTRRDIISANFTIRPSTILSFNGEYKGEFQHRDNTGPTASATTWDLPESTDTHRGNLTVLLRPFKGLRLRGLYEYTTTNNPLYDSEPEQKHEGRLLLTYTSSSRWGLSANYRIARESNDHISRKTHDLMDGTEPRTYLLPLDRHFTHASLGFWVSPAERLTLSGNFGFLQTRSEQGVLFASRFNGMDAVADYVSQGEIYSLNAMYRPLDNLDLSLAYQQVRSRSDFKPATTTSLGTSTDAIRSFSQIKTLEDSLSARADYRVTKNFGCALDYTYRSYNNRLSSDGEGAVHLVTAHLKTTW